MALAAVEAFGVAGVAVQFDNPLRRNARILMQVVDVLRDHRAHLAARHQPCDRRMAGVGFGPGPAGGSGESAAPGFAPSGLAADEFVEIDRLHLAPDPAGAAEVRHAGLCGNASAGKDHRAPRSLNQFGKFGAVSHGSIDQHRRNGEAKAAWAQKIISSGGEIMARCNVSHPDAGGRVRSIVGETVCTSHLNSWSSRRRPAP